MSLTAETNPAIMYWGIFHAPCTLLRKAQCSVAKVNMALSGSCWGKQRTNQELLKDSKSSEYYNITQCPYLWEDLPAAALTEVAGNYF